MERSFMTLHLCLCCYNFAVGRYSLLYTLILQIPSFYVSIGVFRKNLVIWQYIKNKEEFHYLTTPSTHFLRLYDVRHMEKDNSDSEKTRCRHYMGYSFD